MKMLSGCISECEYYYEVYLDEQGWEECMDDCYYDYDLGYFDNEEGDQIAEPNPGTETTRM